MIRTWGFQQDWRLRGAIAVLNERTLLWGVDQEDDLRQTADGANAWLRIPLNVCLRWRTNCDFGDAAGSLVVHLGAAKPSRCAGRIAVPPHTQTRLHAESEGRTHSTYHTRRGHAAGRNVSMKRDGSYGHRKQSQLPPCRQLAGWLKEIEQPPRGAEMEGVGGKPGHRRKEDGRNPRQAKVNNNIKDKKTWSIDCCEVLNRWSVWILM